MAPKLGPHSIAISAPPALSQSVRPSLNVFFFQAIEGSE